MVLVLKPSKHSRNLELVLRLITVRVLSDCESPSKANEMHTKTQGVENSFTSPTSWLCKQMFAMKRP